MRLLKRKPKTIEVEIPLEKGERFYKLGTVAECVDEMTAWIEMLQRDKVLLNRALEKAQTERDKWQNRVAELNNQQTLQMTLQQYHIRIICNQANYMTVSFRPHVSRPGRREEWYDIYPGGKDMLEAIVHNVGLDGWTADKSDRDRTDWFYIRRGFNITSLSRLDTHLKEATSKLQQELDHALVLKARLAAVIPKGGENSGS